MPKIKASKTPNKVRRVNVEIKKVNKGYVVSSYNDHDFDKNKVYVEKNKSEATKRASRLLGS